MNQKLEDIFLFAAEDCGFDRAMLDQITLSQSCVCLDNLKKKMKVGKVYPDLLRFNRLVRLIRPESGKFSADKIRSNVLSMVAVARQQQGTATFKPVAAPTCTSNEAQFKSWLLFKFEGEYLSWTAEFVGGLFLYYELVVTWFRIVKGQIFKNEVYGCCLYLSGLAIERKTTGGSQSREVDLFHAIIDRVNQDFGGCRLYNCENRRKSSLSSSLSTSDDSSMNSGSSTSSANTSDTPKAKRTRRNFKKPDPASFLAAQILPPTSVPSAILGSPSLPIPTDGHEFDPSACLGFPTQHNSADISIQVQSPNSPPIYYPSLSTSSQPVVYDQSLSSFFISHSVDCTVNLTVPLTFQQKHVENDSNNLDFDAEVLDFLSDLISQPFEEEPDNNVPE